MSTTRKELVFEEFIGIADSSINQAIVTVTYNEGDFMMNVVMEDTLIRMNEDNALHLENCNGTELIIKPDAIQSIITEGYEPVNNSFVYRLCLTNNMVVYISLKNY